MTELEDQEGSTGDILMSRITELIGQSDAVDLIADGINERFIEKAKTGLTEEYLLTYVKELLSLGNRGGMIVADKFWLKAMHTQGIPGAQILKIWDERTQVQYQSEEKSLNDSGETL